MSRPDIDVQIVTTPPRVFVAGITTPRVDGIMDYLKYRGATWRTEDDLSEPEAIVEAAGRVCYQSWRNPRNRRRGEYLQEAIIGHGHGSVLEHLWVNLLVADLPRSVQLELVRHGEGTGFSFESQRFTDRLLRFVAPPAVRADPLMLEVFSHKCMRSAYAYMEMLGHLGDSVDGAGRYSEDATLRRKRIKEAARSVLPNCVGSDGMVSVNARALRHILQMRSDVHADASIREFANAAFEATADLLPGVMADVELGEWDLGGRSLGFAARKV